MPLPLLQNTWIFPWLRQVPSFTKTTLPFDMIFTKYDADTSEETVYKLTREFNIHYKDCIKSLLCTREDFSFAVHKLAKFSSSPVKVNFEGLVHLLSYIRYNKTLRLNYYADMNDVPLSDLLK